MNRTSQPEPHKQFILDLQAWVESKTSQGHDIILALDNNKDIETHQGTIHPLLYDSGTHIHSPHHNGSLSTLMKSCELVDILGTQHSARPFPATYSRGKKRLDYILISQSIAMTVINSGILPYQVLFPSDHRAFYIDIDLDLLFKEPTYGIDRPCQRGLKLNAPRIVNKYKDIWHFQSDYHKIVHKQKDLYGLAESSNWCQTETVNYEKVDKIATESMLHAEK